MRVLIIKNVCTIDMEIKILLLDSNVIINTINCEDTYYE